MSYAYWNNFVDHWRNLPLNEYVDGNQLTALPNIFGWTNPNLFPLYGTENNQDLALQYLPEPWWGNDGNHPLESVVINYNPAGLNDQYFGAQTLQNIYQSRNLFGFNSYADFINNEVAHQNVNFPGKFQFHYNKRAYPVLNALNLNPNLVNHLSVELAPWYTPKSNLIVPYINNNLKNVYNHSLLFAANQSRRINNNILNNKVLVRTSKNEFERLLTRMINSGIINGYGISAEGSVPVPQFPVGSGSYCKFEIHDPLLNGIEFITIWKPRPGFSTNDFPLIPQLQWIFNVI